MDSLFWADFFAIWVCGICEYGDVMWEQMARTPRDVLLKAVHVEENRIMKKKSTLYNSNLPSYVC